MSARDGPAGVASALMLRLRSLIIPCDGAPDEERKKRKKSRWGSDNVAEKNLIGALTVLPPSMTPLQQQCYVCTSLNA